MTVVGYTHENETFMLDAAARANRYPNLKSDRVIVESGSKSVSLVLDIQGVSLL